MTRFSFKNRDRVPDSPFEVLLLTLNSSIGGTEKSILELCQRMDRNLFRPCIVTLIGDGTLTDMAGECGIEAIHLGMAGPWDARIVVRLAKLIRARKISILHTYIYHTNILGRILGRICRVPVVVCSQRSTDDWHTRYHRMLDRWTRGLADCTIANCNAAARGTQKKIRVIQTGIDPVAPVPGAVCKALQHKLKIPSGARVIGTVANLRPAKGHAVLVAAAKKILNTFPDTVFVWVGDGDLRRSLQDAIDRAGLQNNFRLAGFHRDTAPYYRIFDLFVLPSRWEGLPLALKEAMSAGLPIVASRVGGIEENLCDGEECVLVEPSRPDLLANGILDCLQHPEKMTAMGDRARMRFDAQNSVDRTVAETQSCYMELLHAKGIA